MLNFKCIIATVHHVVTLQKEKKASRDDDCYTGKMHALQMTAKAEELI